MRSVAESRVSRRLGVAYRMAPMSVFFRKSIFIEPPPMVDDDLQLVEPSLDILEAHFAVLRGQGNPKDAADELREYVELRRWLRARPAAERRAAPIHALRSILSGCARPLSRAGFITLRIGYTEHLRLYMGHIGYQVEEEARGHRYAARACRLLYPLARLHGMSDLWITCAPEQPRLLAHRRTGPRCYVNTIDTPARVLRNPAARALHVSL